MKWLWRPLFSHLIASDIAVLVLWGVLAALHRTPPLDSTALMVTIAAPVVVPSTILRIVVGSMTGLDFGGWRLWTLPCACYFVPLALAWISLSSRARRKELIRTRRLAGLCTSCGYDLRSSPDRCPECGQRVGDETQTAIPNSPG